MGNIDPARLGALVQQLSIAQQQLGTLVNRVLAPLALNMSQLGVLSHFFQNPAQTLSVTELAVDMQLNQPTTTKIVQHLVELGCLAESMDSADARRKRLTLTPQGVGLLQSAYQALTPALVALFGEFDVAEIEAFLSLSAKLNRGMNRTRFGNSI